MTLNLFSEGDLTSADILIFWKSKLETEGIPLIVENLQQKNYLKSTETISVVIGELTPISNYPAIRLVSGSKKSEWLALRVRQDTYQVFFDCCMRRAPHAEQADLFIQDFSGYVQNWIISFDNLQANINNPSITNPITNKWFNSWSDDIQLGYAADGAMRIARISWWGKTINPYVLGAGDVTKPQLQN